MIEPLNVMERRLFLEIVHCGTLLASQASLNAGYGTCESSHVLDGLVEKGYIAKRRERGEWVYCVAEFE